MPPPTAQPTTQHPATTAGCFALGREEKGRPLVMAMDRRTHSVFEQF